MLDGDDGDDGIRMSQAVHNAPNEMRRHLDSGGTANGTTQDSKPRAEPLPAGTSKGYYFNDAVHSLFRLDGVCMRIIDTPQFQRLRELKQLGLTYYVFPSASHNRFEHSLGVAYKAQEAAYQIWQAQGRQLGVQQSDVQTVELAGLCHDLGHGPFSHVFDSEFLKRKGITDWSHEEMSVSILDEIVAELHTKHGEEAEHLLPEHRVKEVKKLILSAHQPALRAASDKKFLYDIVANGVNGIDVDKFDYLARDALHCGVKISCDFDRIMRFSKVIDEEICFKASVHSNIYELYHCRAQMHSNVYNHRKAKGVEHMIVDALLEADKALRFSEKIHHAKDFVTLDDSLLKSIENFHLYNPGYCDVHEGAMRAAQHIIGRLRRRDLYRFVQEVTIPPEQLDRGQWAMPAAHEIVGFYSGPEKLDEKDIILTEKKVNFSMGADNPMDKVHFFKDFDSDEKFRITGRDENSMMPSYFQDKKLRIYSRNSNPTYVAAVNDAFERWTHKRFSGSVKAASPFKLPNSKKRKTQGQDLTQESTESKTLFAYSL